MSFQDLLDGYQSFHTGEFEKNKELFQKLVDEGQSPEVMMVSCCDSRVDPMMITQAEPGSVFMVRNVANLVPPYLADGKSHGTSAALEFGVCHLNVKHIIVMGHAHCGGIKALLQGDVAVAPERGANSDFIVPWMSMITEARKRIESKYGIENRKRLLRELELEGIRVSLGNLMTFSWISDRVKKGDLSVHGWFFELESGEVLALDTTSDQFRPLGN